MKKLNWRSYSAEVLGTFTLVFLGTAAAVFGGGIGTLGIALVFGLTVTAMAFALGGVSGAHFNPAVSLAMLISKRISLKDFLFYIFSQIIGALLGSSLLLLVLKGTKFRPSFAANDIGIAFSSAAHPWLVPLIIEIIITFIFVFVILIVTSKKEHSKVAPMVIGLTLMILILVSFDITGASLNPARSIAPALFQGGSSLSNLWIFIVGPLLGGTLAALLVPVFNKTE